MTIARALQLLAPHLTDAEYWSTVLETWLMACNTAESTDRWIRLRLARRPGRKQHAIHEDDRAAFDALPGRFRVWRGAASPLFASGMSWTLDRTRTEWFARRFERKSWGHRPVIVSRMVLKGDVLTYINTREEQEIVALPMRRRPVLQFLWPDALAPHASPFVKNSEG